jgi:hypothetical protein
VQMRPIISLGCKAGRKAAGMPMFNFRRVCTIVYSCYLFSNSMCVYEFVQINLSKITHKLQLVSCSIGERLPYCAKCFI